MSSPFSPADSLQDALQRHGITLPDDQVERLDRYCRTLWAWNEKLNLTRHTDYEKFVSRDVIDSLQAAALLDAGESVLDVGAGGGVPGVILAIVRPDVNVSLCESVGKKAEALAEMVRELELEVPVLPARLESVLEGHRFDVAVARAVGPMEKILRWMKGRWDRVERLLLIKGPKWAEERGAARHLGLLRDLELRKSAEYAMPGTESKSVILTIRPKGRGDSLSAAKKRT
ncbi:MAG: 16S rRNA (guanine(527)-N(7))-methyltransferase RsmG [Planctomycetes bacterium]|nr:16S rRNA (guanine(527)-N(7))-methyltransferase RsmG [Planctomycetota bacterium]